jgi:GntR family transcriptional regulator, rspAB operon transcriptional repressor
VIAVAVKRSQQTYEALKQQILDWTLPPGTPLPEPELAARLNASRTPVRESLQQLSREGLVRLVPGKGAFVTDISVPDVTELFQMRQALETYASRLAARAPDRNLLKDVVPDLLAAAETINDSDNTAYYELTSKMDRMIVELAGNGRLKVALQHVWDQVYRTRRLAGANPERLLQSIDEHVRILEGIIEGDEEAAAAATFDHVERSLEHVMRSMWRRWPTGGGGEARNEADGHGH